VRVTMVVRLCGLALAGVTAVGTVATTALVATRSQATASAAMAAASNALSRQWNADMMHDTLRADVLGALAARDAADRTTFAVDDVTRHATTFTTALDAARTGAPTTLLADYDTIRPKATTYAALAVDLVHRAGTDPAAARAALPAFLAAFTDLEERLGAVDDRFEASVNAMQVRSEASAATTRAVILTVLVVGSLLLALLSALIVRGIAGPVRHIRARLAEVAAGDFRVVTDTGRTDELGDLARSVDATTASVRAAFTAVEHLTGTLTDNAAGLHAAGSRLSTAARQTADLATSSVTMAEQVSIGAGQVGQGIGTVTAQTHDISASATTAAEVGRRAMTGAQVAADAVTRLGDSSAQISGVASMIRSISDQTRLLALNATIEAARAGDAGRGFAVVASEVKDLAQEVGRATEDISGRIAAIQDEVRDAVDSIRTITQVITEINAHQVDIADAVHRQTGTSAEVTTLISDASRSAESISHSVAAIAAAADQTSTTVGLTLGSAAELTDVAERLREALHHYTF